MILDLWKITLIESIIVVSGKDRDIILMPIVNLYCRCINCECGMRKKSAREKRRMMQQSDHVAQIWNVCVNTFSHFARVTSRSDVKATWQERVKISPLYKYAIWKIYFSVTLIFVIFVSKRTKFLQNEEYYFGVSSAERSLFIHNCNIWKIKGNEC